VSTSAQPVSSHSVLIADRLDRNRRSIIEALTPHQFTCIEAADGITAWNRYLSYRPSVLLSAVDLKDLAPSELLNRIRTHSPAAVAFHSTVNDARLAACIMRAGAHDFFIIPEEAHTIAARLTSIIGIHSKTLRDAARSMLVGHGRLITRLREQLVSIAPLRVPVLLHGEPGSGHDHVVQTLSRLSPGQPQTVVSVRCGSIRLPQRSDSGKIVYLDQIESLSLSDQAQWFIQIRKGEQGALDAPHRVVASSSADLLTLSARGHFHPELAQRLTQFTIEVPALRQRAEDIGDLTRHFAFQVGAEMGRSRITVTASALLLLQQQPWLGNVRELRMAVEKLVAFAVDGRITKEAVSRLVSEAPSGVKSLRSSREQRLRDELIAILDSTGGNLAEAARRMNMSRGAVIYRAQKFGLLAKRVQART